MSQGHLPVQNNNFAVSINSKVEWKLKSHIVKWICGWKIGGKFLIVVPTELTLFINIFIFITLITFNYIL